MTIKPEDVAAALFIAVAIAAEDHRPLRHLRQIADRAGQGRRNGADENIAVLHVGQFVTQNPGKFSLVEDPADSVRDRNRGVLRITPRREGIRGVLRQQVDFGHRQSGPLRQILHHAVELRIVLRSYFLTAIHFENDFVTKPIAEEIHAAGYQQRNDSSLAAAEHITNPHQQSG